MKSLQILTPSRKCMFNCPFCISKTHSHNNKFINNYELNKELWKSNLITILKQHKDLKYVVITGTNEPMQDILCVKDIIDIVRDNRFDIQIEIQTRYYKFDKIYNELDVVAYSISDYNLLNTIKLGNKINRFVIILTDSFNKTLEEILYNVPKEVSQITFKVLQDSNGFNKELDSWILNHKMDIESHKKLLHDINSYRGLISIKYDSNCMESNNRYMIYREDGKLYNNWEEI